MVVLVVVGVAVAVYRLIRVLIRPTRTTKTTTATKRELHNVYSSNECKFASVIVFYNININRINYLLLSPGAGRRERIKDHGHT